MTRIPAYAACSISVMCAVALILYVWANSVEAPAGSWWETQTRAKIDAYASGDRLLRSLIAQTVHIVLDQTRTMWCVNVTRDDTIKAALSADERQYTWPDTQRSYDERVRILLDERWERIKDKFPVELRVKRDYSGIELCWGPDYPRRQ